MPHFFISHHTSYFISLFSKAKLSIRTVQHNIYLKYAWRSNFIFFAIFLLFFKIGTNTTTKMVIVHCTLYTDLTILYKNRVEIVIFWKLEISVGSLHGYLLKNQCRKP